MNKKVAFITGASRGIGFEIAKRLECDGCEIIAPTRKDMDLSDIESVRSYIQKFNVNVDILINNAGINNLGYSYDFKEEDLFNIINTNLISYFLITKKILSGMILNNYGRIVNISSIWSVVSKPNRYIYSVSKAALNAMTRSIAVEVASKNILVNAVAPGFVKTELTFKNNSENEIKEIINKIPVGRLADPKEISEVVSFLVSDKNSYITGQTIIVDGGYTCL